MDPTRVTIAAVGYVFLWVLTVIIYTVLARGTNNPVEKQKLGRNSTIVISVLMVGAAAVAGAPIGVILFVALGCVAFYMVAQWFTTNCQACGHRSQRLGTKFCPKCGTKIESRSKSNGLAT